MRDDDDASHRIERRHVATEAKLGGEAAAMAATASAGRGTHDGGSGGREHTLTLEFVDGSSESLCVHHAHLGSAIARARAICCENTTGSVVGFSPRPISQT